MLQHLGQVGPTTPTSTTGRSRAWRSASPSCGAPPRCASRATTSRLEYEFEALHEAFSYRQNPGGLPAWFARNRFEQAGRVTGVLEVAGARSSSTASPTATTRGARATGVRRSTGSGCSRTRRPGRALNAFIWIARGEWGFNGYVLRDGEPVAIARIDQHARLRRRHGPDAAGGVDRRRRRVDDRRSTLESFGAVRMPHDDPFGTVIIEAACRATIDGEAGGGQFETHWPLKYIDHLAAR